MPQFGAGAVKTAKITLTNPKAKAVDYHAWLYMGADYAPMAEATFSLNAGGSKEVSFTVTMPSGVGTYPVYIGAFSADVLIPPLYRATEDVQIVQQAAVEIVRAYIRMAYPSVSEAYSGWIGISPVGSELNLALFSVGVQVGVLLRNPTQSPLKYTCTMYNYHWILPNNYITDYLTLPSVAPIAFPPAPTGLPYSGYKYECDMFLPPGGELPPGKTGFVYAAASPNNPWARWNYVYIQITCNGKDLGTTLLYWGWYG